MDSAFTLKQHLTQAEKHVEMGAALLAETHVRLHERRRNRREIAEAEATLALLEETQALRIADRDRLRRELEALLGIEAKTPRLDQRKQPRVGDLATEDLRAALTLGRAR